MQSNCPEQSVFVRHNCSSTTAILQQLWNERKIALHYEDKFSVIPEDFSPAGRKALKRLLRYSESGAIVGADFRQLNGEKMLVGILNKDSKVEATMFCDPESGESFIYRVVKLSKAVEVPYVDYPLLAGIQPRQATITGWPSARKILWAALKNESLPREASSLHPSQLEVLCYEWLRGRGKLDRLVLTIGRGVIDIDILGIGQGDKRVIAQVTHSVNVSDLRDKKDRLLRHGRRGVDTMFFFLPDLARLDPCEGVELVTLGSVLKDLESTSESDASTKAMLQEMFAENRQPSTIQLQPGTA